MFSNRCEDTLNQKLLEEADSPPPGYESPTKRIQGLGIDQIEKQYSLKEIRIERTCWNWMKLYFVNTYEVTLICMGLALSIYEDDISSLLFQLVMQVLLCLSLKQMGQKYIRLQRKISLVVLVISALAIIVKSILMIQMEPTLNANYENSKTDWYAFGFEVMTLEDGTVVFDKVQSILFEVLTFMLTCLLVQYYTSQVPKPDIEQSTGYLYHSLWLSQYQKLYYIFFFLIAIDTLFVQNFFQMIVLGFMITLMYLSAYDYHGRHNATRFVVVWAQRLYILQLAMLALTQITYVAEPIKSYSSLYKAFFTLGLILNDQNPLTATAHVFNICAILGFGQLFEQSYINYGIYTKNKLSDPLQTGGIASITTGLMKATKGAKMRLNQEALLGGTPSGTNDGTQMTIQHKSHAVKAVPKGPSFKSYVDKYAPYIYIWICRICSIVLAYYYHSSPAFVLLTWVLLSLIIALVPFVNFTVLFVTPTMTLAFLYMYLINIPGLFFEKGDTAPQHIIYTGYYGYQFKFPVMETALSFFTLTFFILLVPTRHILKMQRDEFRITIFQKLSDKSSNFLWQLCFYILKRFHIIVLFFIFLFGMQEVNIYYIGLLFFFIMFVSSLNTYRRYCGLLVMYASFFIWIQYFWSLIAPYFEVTGMVAKVFMMITFTKIEQNPNGINKYLVYDIPYWQWAILFFYVFMYTINYCFRKDKKIMRQSFENEEIIEYGSSAEYYESKCDYVLRKKFPSTSKFINRIVYIFSNTMILIILIIQGFILAFQPPSILFWGFLILSLTLQRVVVSAGDENPKLYRRCTRQSRILKYYSMFVIILQVIFHFLTDKNFLAQYGFDSYVDIILGPLNKYLDFIGLVSLAGADIKYKFVSQIAFYIMAVILEDYFTEQLVKMNELSDEEQGYENMPSAVQYLDQSPPKNVGRRNTVAFKHSPLNFNAKEEEDNNEQNKEDKCSQIEYKFEKARFTVPFIVYKWMGVWRFLDEVALNFHLVTATITVAFCLHFQISLFFSFYLLCTVALCIRASFALQNKGQFNNGAAQINVDQAHQTNKTYMKQATTKLLQVRKRQWDIQYWLLITSMIIMYPTPFFQQFKERRPEYSQGVDNTIFWMFWSGVYVSREDLDHYGTYAPYYALIIVLIMEKYAQRWQFNRLQCTFDKVSEFKTLEEQMEQIKQTKNPQQVIKTEDSPVPLVDRDDKHMFVTIGEATQECQRIESLYQEETLQIKEDRHKNIVILGIKRKYNTQLRNAMKVGMEQTSLFLLLLSAAYKSNLVSIVYMFILLTFLVIKNKTKGMQILAISFGVILVLQYVAVLLNLTSMTSPYAFPPQFNPYPTGAGDYPNGQYIIPLYSKSEYLKKNLIWTNFFGLDIERASLNKMWFDFINLALMTIYFFWYGNPINSNSVKVSFSSTKSLEYSLNEYAKIQIHKKAEIVKLQKKHMKKYNDEQEQDASDSVDSNSDNDSEVAADDSHEYFLGATFYLNEMKQGVFLYYFTKKARTFFYIGWQIVTLISIFVIAFLCKSFMSIGYMVACVPLILFVNDFFRQEQLSFSGQSWRHPYYICGPIMVFSFIDIALQILIQVPLEYHEQKWMQWFGFQKIWLIDPKANFGKLCGSSVAMFGLNSDHLKYLILKCLNMFFIFLQSRIYESESFKKFMKRDLRKLLNLAKNYKKLAITYRFNNLKLQQIVVSQSNLKHMYEGVATLKMKIRTWQELTTKGLMLLTDLESQKKIMPETQVEKSSLVEPLLSNQGSSKREEEQEPEREKQIYTTQKTKKKVGFEKLAPGAVKGLVIKRLSDRTDEQREKARVLKEQKGKLPFLARMYMCLHKKSINHIFFLSEIEEASIIKKAMQSGNRKICSELETRMIDDVNMHFRHIKPQKSKIKLNKSALKIISEIEEYRIEQMPKTSQFIRLSNILQALVYATLQAVASNFSAFSYFFMTISQIVSGGLITIVYPFAVFGYALMEEGRPGKYFWEFMIRYTLFILFMKFIFQLDCWQSIAGLSEAYTSINDWVQIGLWRSSSTINLFGYIIPEIMILVTIMGQQFYENLIGLYDYREIEIENIEQARKRYLASVAGIREMGTTFMLKENMKEKEINLEDEEQELIKQLPNQLETLWMEEEKRLQKDDPEFFMFTADLKVKEPFSKEIKDFLPPRTYTQIDDKKLRYNTAIDVKRERKLRKKEKFIKKNFSRSSYFRRLFPLIKEQKPGMDLYAWITLVQFTICIYLISFYTSIDTEGTQNLESSSQFSINMVVVLFIQIAVMITERYVNRTNPRHVVKEIGQKKEDNDIMKDDEIYEKLKLENGDTFPTAIYEQEKMRDTMMGRQMRTDSTGTRAEIPKIILAKTRMTTQQVTKFFVQWVLLIIYHALVFWYYPINSNYVIYGKPTCNPESHSYGTYGCLSFHQNHALIWFYVIFCIYFTLSAVQIRYGLPDYRAGSSLMQERNNLYRYTWLVYYNIPFLMELKTILDWCFTKTALDLMEWLQLAQFNSEMFLANIGGYYTYKKKFGEKIATAEKWICGCLCVGTILFFLIGPFLMFSNLSFIASYNMVTEASVNLGIKIRNNDTKETYQFPLYTATNALSIETVTEHDFNKDKYHEHPETKFFDYDQVQTIKIKGGSETEWALSSDYRTQFQRLLNDSYRKEANISIEIAMTYAFMRPGPELAQKASATNIKNLDSKNNNDTIIIYSLLNASTLGQQVCKSNPNAVQDIILPNFLITGVRLTEKSSVQNISTEAFPAKDVKLTYSCENFWSINVDDKGITFIAFSDLISSGFFSATSIMGFYLGVALVVGQSFRSMFIYKGDRVFIVDSPNTGALLNLINCIYISRIEMDTKKEEELFHILLEVLRSPELLKHIAGTSLRAKL